MIIQTGQRTDIPAFYSEWFLNRIREGFVLVRNPYNEHQVTRYRLDKACSLLREGTNVTEAALSCGFHGSSYFAEVFKRTWHITPREYQRNFHHQTAQE